jgi:hypothetical protein
MAVGIKSFGAQTCTVKGKVVNVIGIQRFLDYCASSSFSNVDIFASTTDLEHRWKKCNMGCHHPGYRTGSSKRTETWTNAVQTIEGVPVFGQVAARVLDPITGALILGGGVVRTGDVFNQEGFDKIGAENYAAIDLVQTLLTQAYNVSLSAVDNPITTMIIHLIADYTLSIPEEVLVQLATTGKLNLNDFDVHMTTRAIQKGLTYLAASAATQAAITYIKNHPEKVVEYFKNKAIDKLSTYIATIITVKITKSILKSLPSSWHYKNFLDATKFTKTTKGLADALLILLKTQGTLQTAGEASRRLHAKLPTLWGDMRHTHGVDMVYYMVEDFVKEYVDRISLAQNDPARFAEMVLAILEPPGTAKDLFFPFK